MSRIYLTHEPRDIMALANSFDASVTYSIQAESPYNDLVHIDDADTKPSETEVAGRKVRDLETVTAKAGTAGKLWIWAPAASPETTVHVNIFPVA